MKNVAVFVAALLYCCCATQARVSCTNVWHAGTLVEIISRPEIFGPSLHFLLPGHGADLATCLTNPEFCVSYACAAGTEGESCADVEAGSCLAYLLSSCTGGVPTIRLIEIDSAGACPAP